MNILGKKWGHGATGRKVADSIPDVDIVIFHWHTVFARVICALFFPILAAEKSGCVKYADFFVEVLIWVLF
jgi:hypothetical protein